jgi:hypothetical protein
MGFLNRVSFGIWAVVTLGACMASEESDLDISTTEQAVVVTTGFISEENGQSDGGGAHCPAGTVAMGYECNGRFCDNQRLLCDSFPGTLGVLQPWSQWFSEENPGQNCSGLDEWVTAIQCRGSFCDDIRFRCRKATVAGARTVERDQCFQTGSVSEENPPLTLEGTGRFFGGLTCHGSNCDNVSALSCRPQTRCDSGLGCTFNSGAPCQCDAVCASFGDCCPNKVNECGP